jgi:hypothetical protein
MSARKILASEFLKFVLKAQRMVGNGQELSADPDVFRQFIDKATPFLVFDVRRSLDKIAALAALAKRWLVSHDLLFDAGLTYEDSYTSLMAWALRPDTHSPSAKRRQQMWLNSLGLGGEFKVRKPCLPKLWLATDDGIPDLVLQFQDGAVVVEAKTKSAEHSTPSRRMQGFAYPPAVRRKLGLGPNACVRMVFICPNRQESSNREAKSTTFVEFVLAMAKALEKEDLPMDTRAAYAMLFTHFMTYAAPSGTKLRKLIDEIVEWSQLPGWHQAGQVVRHLDQLLKAKEIILPEGK